MKKQILFGLLAAGMLAACSSDDSLSENQLNQYHMVEGQPAFISLGIAMPGAPQTRANDDFDDGAADEYAVKSGKLVLFKGASEETATLFGSYDVPTTFNLEGTTTDQITSSTAKFVQQIEAPNLGASEKLYAYVILNQKDNATGIDLSTGQTFATFSKKVLLAIGIANEAKGYGAENTTNGFVMTSVPFSTKQGGSNNPSGATIKTLTEINATAVYPTKEQAEASSAQVACIYVERAAVKIDVTFKTDITDPAGSLVPVTLDGWCLGNVNNGGTTGSGYYNVRQFDAAWLAYNNPENATPGTLYRFVSVDPFFSSGHAMGYRTYFGKDVNYDGRTGLIGGKVAETDHTLASGATVFTYENTFDENSQIYANTTYVSFKTTLNNGNTFWTLKGADNTAIVAEATLKDKLSSNIDAQLSTKITEIKNKIEAAITADLAGTNTIGATTGVTFKLKHDITLNAKDANANVTYSDKLALDEVKVDGSDATTAQLAAINALIYESSTTIADKLAANLTDYTADVVTEYTDGVTYYATRIAHFGNNETPWSAPAEAFGNYAKIYPTTGVSGHVSPETPVTYGTNRADAWLGRWGILRNNWYSLSVTNITGIGDALPVDYTGTSPLTPGGTPDDNPDPKYYIAAHIHILPWVKRAQSVVLK